MASKLGLGNPLTKEDFLGESPDMISAKKIQEKSNNIGRPKKNKATTTIKKTITMYQSDIDTINKINDRCLKMGIKDKGITGSIRMAIKMLELSKDKDFLDIYHKY
jgi:hypothetical protein